MTDQLMTAETTEPAAPARPAPGAAVIEVVERHRGPERHPTTGPGSLLLPNQLRINGMVMLATEDYPVVVHEITMDGSSFTPAAFAVTVSLFARTLRVGEAPTGRPAEEGGIRAAVVEIPDVGGPVEAGQELERPYVYLNGHRLYLAGRIVVEPMTVPSQESVRVAVPLLCRSLRVDDEIIDEVVPVP